MTPGWPHYALAGALAFGANVPFGWLRAPRPKFGLVWLALVHAPVPMVIALRLWLGLDPWVAVPVNVALAIAGQLVGVRLWRRRHADLTASSS